MKRILAVVAAVAAILFLAAPAAFAHTKVSRTPPRIESGVPLFLQVNQNLCLNANGADNQLTISNKSNGCTNWHANTNQFFVDTLIIDGGGNCMRENNSDQITVVSNCNSGDATQLFYFASCGTDCDKIVNDANNNYVSTTGGTGGDKVWGGFSPTNHVDWIVG